MSSFVQHKRRRSAVVLTAVAALSVAGTSAWAYWSTQAQGQGVAATTTVNQASAPIASRGTDKVSLSWAAVTLANGAPVDGYRIYRFDGSGSTLACSSTAPTLTCDDTAPVAGTVSYAAVAYKGSWTGAESGRTAFTFDVFAPVTTVTMRTPAPNAAGWNTGDVSVTLGAIDPAPAASGVKEIHYKLAGTEHVVTGGTASFTVTAEQTNSLSFWAVDVLGNTESPKSAQDIDIDRTKPSTSTSVSGTANGAGWYNANVAVSLNATDNLSGVSKTEYSLDGSTPSTTYTSPIQVSTDGQTTVTYRATDVAGNVEVPQTRVIKLDKTAPTTIAGTTGTAGTNNWFKSDVSVTLTPTTDTSGIASTTYSLDGGTTWLPYSAPFSLTSEGTTTVLYRSTDVAGNTEQSKTLVVKIDKSSPASTGNLNGSSLTLSATDTGPSGVARIEYKIGTGSTYSTYPGSAVTLNPGQTAYFHAVDLAGNVEAPDHAVTYNADTTGPDLAFVGLTEGTTYANNNGSANPWSAVCSTGQICVTASDPSGVAGPSVKYTLEATSGTNVGKCWSGSAWVAKANGACTLVNMTLANGRYEGGTISNGNMKTGAYTATVTAQDASSSANASSVTRKFSIG